MGWGATDISTSILWIAIISSKVVMVGTSRAADYATSNGIRIGTIVTPDVMHGLISAFGQPKKGTPPGTYEFDAAGIMIDIVENKVADVTVFKKEK